MKSKHLASTLIAVVTLLTMCAAFLTGCESNRDEVMQEFKQKLVEDYPDMDVTEMECKYDSDDSEWDCNARIGKDRIRVSYECKKGSSFDYYCEND